MNKTTRNILIIVGIIVMLICCCCAAIYAFFAIIEEEGDGFFEPIFEDVIDALSTIEIEEEFPLGVTPEPGAPPVQETGFGEFREAECPFPGEFKRITCGYLTVPEDRSNPEGRKIGWSQTCLRYPQNRCQRRPSIHRSGPRRLPGTIWIRLLNLSVHTPF